MIIHDRVCVNPPVGDEDGLLFFNPAPVASNRSLPYAPSCMRRLYPLTVPGQFDILAIMA